MLILICIVSLDFSSILFFFLQQNVLICLMVLIDLDIDFGSTCFLQIFGPKCFTGSKSQGPLDKRGLTSLLTKKGCLEVAIGTMSSHKWMRVCC